MMRWYLLVFLFTLAGMANAVTSPLTAMLEFDKSSYYLGEPVLVHFGLKNTSDMPVEFNMGGDYRGIRETRFIVTATDAHGKVVPDPFTRVNCMGGESGGHTIYPGETWWHSLALWNYREFTQPGRYTVRVTHDLGWNGNSDIPLHGVPRGATPPVGEGALMLVMPTPAQAQHVLALMSKLPADNHHIKSDGRSEPYADLTALTIPVYVPFLRTAAEKGDDFAIEGISSIGDPTATAALIALAGNRHHAVARAAVEALAERVPNAGGWRLDLRRDFPQRTWRTTFTPAVRQRARALLAKPDTLTIGAQILTGVGNAHDLPLMRNKLNAAIAAGDDNTAAEFIYTATGMFQRGVKPPSGKRSAGQAMLLLTYLNTHPNARPIGWRETTRWMLAHPNAFVRFTALRGMPVPIEATFLPTIRALLAGKDQLQQYVVLELVTRAKDARFTETALKLLQHSEDESVISAAQEAAVASGVPADRWAEVCINRLTDQKQGDRMLMMLSTGLVAHTGGYAYGGGIEPADAACLQANWRQFLSDHRSEIHAGKRYASCQPLLTAGLFAPAFYFYLPDGSRWPPKPSRAPQVTLTKDDDRASVTLNEGHAVIDITSARGIGGAKLTFLRPRPATITLRLHLHGLEELNLDAGEVSITATVNSSDGTIREAICSDAQKSGEFTLSHDSPLWLVITHAPSASAFDIILPVALVHNGSDFLNVRWIDFYR